MPRLGSALTAAFMSGCSSAIPPSVTPPPPSATPSVDMRQAVGCPDLSGKYHFAGEPSGENQALLAEDLRFDSAALAAIVRTVVGPHTAILNHDRSGGTISVDVVGNGTDLRFAPMSAKLPVVTSFTCDGTDWQMSRVSIGSGGGGRSSTTTWRITLKSVPNGLIADGSEVSEVGTLSRKTLTRSWKVLFRHQN
jgi:hypothetical protein